MAKALTQHTDQASYEALRFKVGRIAAELKELASELDKAYYDEDADPYSG